MRNISDIGSGEELFSPWSEAHRTEKNTDYLSANIPKDMFLPDGIIDHLGEVV